MEREIANKTGLLKKIFREITYTFFPINISFNEQNDEYVKTIEYKRLDAFIQSFSKDRNKVIEAIEMELKAVAPDFIYRNYTMFSWQDRCYNLQLLEVKTENVVYAICVNISILIPYYTLYVLKVNIKDKRWQKLPTRDVKAENDMFAPELKKIKAVLESYGLSVFPPELWMRSLKTLILMK